MVLQAGCSHCRYRAAVPAARLLHCRLGVRCGSPGQSPFSELPMRFSVLSVRIPRFRWVGCLCSFHQCSTAHSSRTCRVSGLSPTPLAAPGSYPRWLSSSSSHSLPTSSTTALLGESVGSLTVTLVQPLPSALPAPNLLSIAREACRPTRLCNRPLTAAAERPAKIRVMPVARPCALTWVGYTKGKSTTPHHPEGATRQGRRGGQGRSLPRLGSFNVHRVRPCFWPTPARGCHTDRPRYF